MKTVLVLFGVLDISVIILALSDGRIFSLLTAGFNPILFWMQLGYTVMYFTLGFSAYFLLRQDKIGLYFTYAQFPFRYLTSAFSFTFLWSLNDFVRDFFFPTNIYVKEEYLLKGLIGLEFVRLVVTIFLHIKLFKRPADVMT